jgi:hypothetical protein
VKGADVEEVGAVDASKLGLGGGVELCLEASQRLDDRESRVDRMRPFVALGGVPRGCLDGDARPDHSHGDEVEASVRRLRDDDAVRRRAFEARGESAVPPALLLDHALVDEPAGQPAVGEGGLDREEHGRDPALHVAGATPVQTSVADLGAERRSRPLAPRRLADDVDVPVEEERASASPGQGPDNTAAPFVRDERNAAVRVSAEPLQARLDRAYGEAEVAQSLLDEPLRGLLVAEQARNADQLLQEHDGTR